MARVQLMHGLGQEHCRRELAEHKSARVALRSLRQQRAKVAHRSFGADHDRILLQRLT
jgi:hypothetical protein